jgi:hypothetical protein
MASHLAQLAFSFSVIATCKGYPVFRLVISQQEQRVRFQRRRSIIEKRSGFRGMSWTFRKLAQKCWRNGDMMDPGQLHNFIR